MASSRTAAAAKAAKATKAEEPKTTKKAAPKTAAKKEKAAAATEKLAASRKRKADDEAEAPKAKKTKAVSEKPAPAPKKAAAKKAEPKKAAVAKKTEAKKAGPKQVETKKPVAKKASTKKAAPTKKEKVEDEDIEMEEAPAPKAPAARPKKVPVPKLPPAPKVRTAGPAINDLPSQRLEVFVFGEGSSGELGMGSKRRDGKKPVDVKRPRYNDLLSPEDTGVVQIACGGMHAAALTAEGKILTWGVNDDGALGRSSEWDGGLRDMDKEDSDSDSDDEDDTGVNPMESTPAAVSTEGFIGGTEIAQVAACDSATFALTRDGRVYGWGTFRASDGILGFSETTKIQRTPVEITGLKNISQLAGGSNHILALSIKGEVSAWGSGEQCQLGRRIGERYKMKALQPQHVGVPKSKTNPIVKVTGGSYHSFALTSDGRVYGWGLNNFGQVGVEGGAGEGDAMVNSPSVVKSLAEYKIKDIAGGEHHSLACTDDGKLLVWGRIDGHQVGLPKEAYTEDNTVFDDNERPRLLFKPTIVEGIPPIESVAAGTDTSFAVTTDGKVYTWGFSANYQTGLGTTDDIEQPTVIDNSAIKEKRVIFAAGGGQYSLVCALPASTALANGTESSDAKA
ncbi:hypothetical protein BROUX41_002955 [Berkeleyomyces rouxiae]|uniref:uncharacterized protein n=1 Tax=Berkeleyomyces rouxiae TaxID=2035830 RepID=UPI003B7DC792